MTGPVDLVPSHLREDTRVHYDAIMDALKEASNAQAYTMALIVALGDIIGAICHQRGNTAALDDCTCAMAAVAKHTISTLDNIEAKLAGSAA